MRNRLVLAGGALLALALLGFGGGYVYYFGNLRSAPAPLTASTPAASPSPGVSPAATAGSLAGSWTVGAGSQAEYRVSEQFAGQTSSHEAVARTSGIGGSLTVTGASGSLQATSITVTADLAGLHSVDQVAGFNVTNRDNIVSRSLSVGQFPKATFTASAVTIPGALESGQAATVMVSGTLTIHGVTREIGADLQLQPTAAGVEVKGTIKTDMTQFGISPPQVPITVVQPAVTIDFVVEFTRSA